MSPEQQLTLSKLRKFAAAATVRAVRLRVRTVPQPHVVVPVEVAPEPVLLAA